MIDHRSYAANFKQSRVSIFVVRRCGGVGQMLTTQSLPGSGVEGHGALLSRAQGHFTCSINAVWTFSTPIADARGGNKRKLLNNSINPLCLLFLCHFF